MASFDRGFNYEIIYELGGLKGFSLCATGHYSQDFDYIPNGEYVKVMLNRHHKTTFYLYQFEDGSYTIRAADGNYKDWYLSQYPHQKSKNYAYLTLKKNRTGDCFWYFDPIKGAVWDKNKLIIRN